MWTPVRAEHAILVGKKVDGHQRKDRESALLSISTHKPTTGVQRFRQSDRSVMENALGGSPRDFRGNDRERKRSFVGNRAAEDRTGERVGVVLGFKKKTDEPWPPLRKQKGKKTNRKNLRRGAPEGAGIA